MERGVRPIRHLPYEPMSQGVPEHVIDVKRIIGIIADDMFPEAPLPYAPFSPLATRLRAPFGSWNRPNEANLDHLPAVGKIVISRQQGPHTMQVIGQNHPGIDVKRPLTALHPDRLAERIHIPDQGISLLLLRIHRKEAGASQHPITPVVGHQLPHRRADAR